MKKKKSWQEKLQDSKGLPKVGKVEGKMTKKWGTGTMVIPAPIEVDEVMRTVPKGKLTTINEIRIRLAKKHKADLGCPITTGIFAWIAAHAAAEAASEGKKQVTPYWRTLKTGGQLNEKYPGGIPALKKQLQAEGHKVVQKGSGTWCQTTKIRWSLEDGRADNPDVRGSVLNLWRICGAAFFLSGLAGLAAEPAGEDWPFFLGPRHNGISAETNLLDRFPTNGPRSVWAKTIGAGYGAPSVLGNRLVVHHRLGDKEIVECLDARTGESQWKYDYPSKFVDPYGYNNGPRSSPVLSSDRCYTFGAEGKLLCLDLANGKLVWQRDTARDWSVPEAFFGVGSTPLLDGGHLYVMVGGQPNAGVVALDALTGEKLWENVGQTNWSGVTTLGWRAERPYEWTGFEKSTSYSSPVMATFHGQKHLLCFMRQGLVSLNPTNGAIRFSRWFQSFANDSVNAMVPVVEENDILISAAYYRVGAVLLRVKPDGNSFEEVWRKPTSPFMRNPETGEFSPPVLEIHWTTPVLHDGVLYVFSGRNEPDATFRCVDYKTGKLFWSRDERWAGHPAPGTKAQPPVFGRGSAILADGKLFALGEGGLLGLFKANTKAVEEISRWQVPQLHFPCWAAPILSRQKLYLRSENALVCLDLGKQNP